MVSKRHGLTDNVRDLQRTFKLVDCRITNRGEYRQTTNNDKLRLMPAKNTTRLTDIQKQTIAVLRTQGMSNHAIAAKLGVHHITVSKAYSEFRRDAAPVIDDVGKDWRNDLKVLAIKAVKRGLTDESDSFKSGSIGVQALKGLGEFEAGNTVNIQAIINSVPPHMRERYLGTGENGALADATETTIENSDKD
jgi:hypothetical protein